MSEFNFNSQVCTTKVQSERLLALGLKRETADMSHTAIVVNHKVQYMEHCSTPKGIDIPAWSLHRLLSMIPNILKAEKPFENSFSSVMNIMISTLGIAYYYEDYDENRIYEFECFENLMEASVSAIEWLIKEGYFPKEYLV